MFDKILNESAKFYVLRAFMGTWSTWVLGFVGGVDQKVVQLQVAWVHKLLAWVNKFLV